MEVVQYIPRKIRSWDLIDFLVSCRDQCASTGEVADEFWVPLSVARESLEALKAIDRVSEIVRDGWHLE